MDFQLLVDQVGMSCCVLAVEKTEARECGRIWVLCANEKYKETMGPSYYDGMPYEELVPKDNKFEDYCFRAAHGGQKMHAYVETKALGAWTDQTLIPLASDRGDMGYCMFVFEYTGERDVSRMADVSRSIAEETIKACLMLMEGDHFETNLQDVLRDLVTSCDAKACRILLPDHEDRRVILLGEALSEDAYPVRGLQREDISYELLASWESTIGVSNAILIQSEADMEYLSSQNPEWTRSLREHHISSLILVPLRRRKKIIGYLYVVNFNVSRAVRVKELLELMSVILGAEIAENLLVQKLEKLSRLDGLTGLYNRRALLEELKRLRESKASPCFGVVNIDLNGLKIVNDRDGHEAGDRLLVQAGEILRKVFYQDDLFRTGGDEFIVITRDIHRDTFERKVGKLQKDIEKNSSVSFAVGSYWSDGSLYPDEVLQRTDERMYADKKAYYEKHPELARK